MLSPAISRITVGACTAQQFEQVKEYIAEFRLDNRELKQEQFLVQAHDNEIIAFGRVRQYEKFSEICSMGVVNHQRARGFGKQMFAALLEAAKKPVYIVNIVPDYYATFGFVACDNFPSEILDKLNYCTGNLPVDETYVVMKKS